MLNDLYDVLKQSNRSSVLSYMSQRQDSKLFSPNHDSLIFSDKAHQDFCRIVMVVPGMDRNRGRTSHQRESRFDSSRRKSDFGKRDSGKPTKQEDDRRSDAKDANENGADKSERKGQKIIVDAETGQKKFTGRCRLFVGNIPSDTKEEDFREMFKEHGESSEIFLNPSRGFGFIRLVSPVVSG